jgi:hypothetical protein
VQKAGPETKTKNCPERNNLTERFWNSVDGSLPVRFTLPAGNSPDNSIYTKVGKVKGDESSKSKEDFFNDGEHECLQNLVNLYRMARRSYL